MELGRRDEMTKEGEVVVKEVERRHSGKAEDDENEKE